MKVVDVFTCAFLSLLLLATNSWADTNQQKREKADQYYQRGDYGKAFNMYLKLAKLGNQHSQKRVSHMYATGEGTSVDLEDAYAWSVLAAENGSLALLEKSNELKQRVPDKAEAEEKASKLIKRYGQAALKEKAASKERHKANHAMGGCTGSRLGCS